MAVVIDEMEVTSGQQPAVPRGNAGPGTDASKPVALTIRQIELAIRRAAERAQRLAAD